MFEVRRKSEKENVLLFSTFSLTIAQTMIKCIYGYDEVTPSNEEIKAYQNKDIKITIQKI